MKKRMTRLLSALLTLIMVLGMLPGGLFQSTEVLAAESSGAVVVYDFKDFAVKSAEAAAKDSSHWWNQLRAGGDDYTKIVGCDYAVSMTNVAAYNGASNSMLSAMKDENWTINETDSVLTNSYYAKKVWFNADPDVEWGMALNSTSYTALSNPTRARLVLDIQVPADGQYRVDLNAFLTSEKETQTDTRGNGSANLYVNGEQQKANVSFGAADKGTKTINVAEYIALEEGTNTFTIEACNAAYVMYFNNLTLTEIVCDCEELEAKTDPMGSNTHKSYDQCTSCGKVYNEEIEDCTEGDEVLVCGVCGADMDCTHDELTYMGYNFKQMMKEAAKTDWWAALPTVTTAGGKETKRVGNAYGTSMKAEEQAVYNEMQDWFMENYGWNFNAESNLISSYGNRVYLCADDSVAWGIWHHAYFPFTEGRNKMSMDIEVEKAGWYDVDLSIYLQNANGTAYPKDSSSGTQSAGGYSDVYVNGELVKEDVFFGGDNTVSDVKIGTVYLIEGTNTINLQICKTNAGATSGYGGAVSSNLVGMTMMEMGHTPNLDGTHTMGSTCSKCGTVWGGEIVDDCADESGDGYCDLCGYLLNCDHPTTEEKVVSVGKNQHKRYEVCTVEGCGKELDGAVIEDCTEGDEAGICGECGAVIKDLNNISIDFVELFNKASEQKWWNDLEDAKEDTKQAGSNSSSDAMSASQTAAYESLREFMLEETGWTINEDLVLATNPYVAKQVFFTTSEKAGWGIAVYPTYLAHADRSKLSFDVVCEQEGWYNLTVGAYKESSTGSSATYTGKYLGGGRANVYLNNEKLYNEYSFGGSNVYAADSMGMVYLTEGVNTITFDLVKDYNGTTNNGRRCIFIKDMSLTYLGDVEVECGLNTTMDLRTSYLQFDDSVEGFEATCVDEEVATASFDADGNVVLKGISEGDTMAIVTNGSDVVCEVPVKVVPKTSVVFDFSKGSEKTAGKKGFAAIKNYDSLPDDGITSDPWYTSYVGDSAKWNTANATAVIKGEVQFTVDVASEGWHDTTLDVYLQETGADVKVYLAPVGEDTTDEAYYLGTVNTKASAKARRQLSLRSVNLTEGEYILTLVTDGELWLNSIRFKPGAEPKLFLEAKAVADKQGRTMQTVVTAKWNSGMAEDLVGAQWALVRSAEGVTPWMDDTTLYVIGDKAGEYTVEVYATINGVEGVAEVPVTVYETSPLATADVSIHNVETGRVARNTVQTFDFDLVGEDGQAIYFNETEVNYSASTEGIVEFMEEDGAFMGIANGETDITVEIPAVGFTKTFHVTVADSGENLLRTHDGDFEFGEEVSNAIWHWQPGFGPESSQYNAKAWAFGSVIEEEDGNHCFKLEINPNGAYNISTSGTEAVLSAGSYVKLEPGKMYEISMRSRSENMAAPAGSNGGLMYSFQAYDFAAQARGTTLSLVYTSAELNQNDPEWKTYKLRVMAPVNHDGPIYVMPRVILRQNSTADYNLTGFTGTAYVDDFEFREVGFDHVEASLESNPKDTVTPVNLAIHAYSTTGDIVDIKDKFVADVVTVTSSNEDVVVVEGAVTRVKDLNGKYMPIVPVRLVGMNDEAHLEVKVNIHGVEKTCLVDMTTTGLEEVLRDVTYRLDGATAANLKVGEVAEGDLNGRTTQLVPINEAYVRENGNIYFKSSNEAVAMVDQATGDVTAVGEGTATITAYAMVDGITRTASCTVKVSDDTDLAAISLSTPVSYVGTGNTMTIALAGTKASGGPADMANFTVAFKLDDAAVEAGLATIDDDGILTANKAGTVTVTAETSVGGEVISASITLSIVENEELAAEHVVIDFTDGRTIFGENATIDENGYEINRDLTYGKGASILHNYKGGLSCSPGVGGTVAVDVLVRKSGWYTAKVSGAIFSYGGISDVFVDDMFVGVLDNKNGGSGSHYGANCNGNTIWLDAGIHTWSVTCTTSGSVFIGTLQLLADNDPGEIAIEAALKDELMVGEKASVVLDMENDSVWGSTMLKAVDAAPEYTNYYVLTSSDTKVATVSKGVVTGVAAGEAAITMEAVLSNGQTYSKTFDIMVAEGLVGSVELTAEKTTMKPTDEGTQLSVIGYDAEGIKMAELPEGLEITYTAEENDILTVSEDGYVALTGAEGSAKITVTVVENGRDLEAAIWITVTSGKSEPTLFTYEERAIAQENTMKYSWAWEEKAAAVTYADYVVEHLDQFYDVLIYETFPRSTAVGFKSDPDQYTCRYCHYDLNKITSHYGWLVDPIEDPWKIQCPVCKNRFPSNDFGAYYESGLDEHGRFNAELADPQYLVNELYPEMGEGWGVDNGFGYDTGNVYYNGVQEVHTYIAYYMHCVFDGLGKSENDLTGALDNLRKAYIYTGDEKYGSAGAILIARVAEIYPEYDIYKYSYSYPGGDGNSHRGKFIGSIWEATTMGQCLAQAADAFWPAMDNDDVIEYLKARAVQYNYDPDVIDPEYVRNLVDEGVLLEIANAVYTGYADGNFGMEQAAMAYAAVALDRLPESQEMIDWIFRYGEKEGSGRNYTYGGGLVLYNIVNLVCRDGFGNEGSHAYNAMWYTNLLEVADALNGYDRVEGADLWANPKFVNMVGGMMKLTTMGCVIPSWGEAGHIQFHKSGMDVDSMLAGFIATGNRDLAVAIYAANGNTTEGLHGTIFTKNPESGIKAQIERIVAEDGVFNFSESNMLCGLGMAFLREGPAQYLGTENADQFSDYWMFFGRSAGGAHTNLDILNIDIDAFGLNLSSDLGYPTTVNAQDPERMQFTMHTTSHNTVVVNDKAQLGVQPNNFPYHFEDAGKAKVMDADASRVYEETDIYRRTMVVMDNGEGVNYAVDFFRVLGGSEHVYSFHAATMKDPTTTGLDFTYQPMGTYAGADVAFGDHTVNPGTTDAAANQGSGYSWLREVNRDATPDTTFSIDWPVEDFKNRLATSDGIHLKLTMVSEEPMTEVATAHGQPPQNANNPEFIEYALIRRSGDAGMDTLFTSVIEPYQYESYIASVELLDAVLLEGTEGITDKAAVLKVTLTSGREDYIVYATNPDCLYSIVEDGEEVFTFKGFAGVCSYENGTLTYAWGNEVTSITDADMGSVIDDVLPKVTGTVVDFTKELSDEYTMTVKLDQNVSEEELTGRYIYVDNDRQQNGAYRIYGAEITGDIAVLDLHTQDMIRNFIDPTNINGGYIYNIAEGQTFSIPLSATFDAEALFTFTEDQVVKAGNKLNLTTGVAGAGYTYAADGLASGMKLDSRTGALSWTTSRTSVGRYPITIKAVDASGDVVGTMSFTVYVVSYTGSTYGADVCAHSKAVTYTVDNGDGTTNIETVCPACGTVTKVTEGEAEEAEKFEIAGANMSLGNELKLNVMVRNTDLTSGTYTAKITHGDTVTEAVFTKLNGTYSYVSYAVSAKQMADVITVEVYDEDGNAVSEVYETSVRDYAMKALASTTTTAKMKTLAVDMLNYGAEAQTYFGYNEADLANALLTEEQKALATAKVSCSNSQVKGSNFYGSNLALEDRIVLNLYFKNCTDDMYAVVSYTDYRGNAQTVEKSLVRQSGNIYRVIVDDIVLADAFSNVTVTVYNANGTVHGTATDSVESYAARAGENALNEAIMKFAASAKAYLR